MILVLVDVTHTTGQCFLREVQNIVMQRCSNVLLQRFVARDQMFVMVATGIVNDRVRIELPQEFS